MIKLLTETRLGDDALRGIAGFARTSFVHRNDPELVFVSFLYPICDFSHGPIPRNGRSVDPLSSLLVPHLDDVFLYRSSSVVGGRRPSQIHEILVPVFELRATGFPWFVLKRQKKKNEKVLFYSTIKFS